MINRNVFIAEVRELMEKHNLDFFEAISMRLEDMTDGDEYDIAEILTPDEIRNIKSLATTKHNFSIEDKNDSYDPSAPDITF